VLRHHGGGTAFTAKLVEHLTHFIAIDSHRLHVKLRCIQPMAAMHMAAMAATARSGTW